MGQILKYRPTWTSQCHICIAKGNLYSLNPYSQVGIYLEEILRQMYNIHEYKIQWGSVLKDFYVIISYVNYEMYKKIYIDMV